MLTASAALMIAPGHVSRSPHLALLRCTAPPVLLNRKQRRHHLQPPGTPYPTAGPATTLIPSTLAGVAEDHAFEQFFFDESTREYLLKLLYERHKKPLLLCAPSLAVDAEELSKPYLLLDRDERFRFLSGFQSFDLDRPEAVSDFEYDCVLCDPPFANFELARLREVLDALAGGDAKRRTVPLYLCYNAKREASIAKAFHDRQLTRLGNGPLGYASVKRATQQQIHLYGLKGSRSVSCTDYSHAQGAQGEE